MAVADLERILWAVAARFNFTPDDLLGLPIRELWFWYRGHQALAREEAEYTAQLLGGKKK